MPALPPNPATASLTPAEGGAARPRGGAGRRSSRAATPAGSDAMSPQRLTCLPRRLPCATTCPISRSTAGCSGSLSAATRPPLSRDAAITYWVRSLLPIEKKSAGSSSIAMAAAGISTMMPSGGMSAATLGRQLGEARPRRQLARLLDSSGVATIGSMTLSGPCDGGAQQRAHLGAEQLGPVQAQADAAQAEERVALAGRLRPGSGLSPPTSSVRIDAPACRRPAASRRGIGA